VNDVKSYPLAFTISKQDYSFYLILKERIEATGKLFGVPLENLMLRPDTINGIPSFVVYTTKNLLERGKKEGIFRVSANTIQLQALKEKLNQGEFCDFSQVDIHILSNVLKSFLRELPVPVITFDLYQPLLDISNLINKSEDKELHLPLLKSILDQLPLSHYHLLFFLAKFLNEMSHYSEMTKMGIDNLSIIFAANILRPENDLPEISSTDLPHCIAILRTIIKNVDKLYDEDRTPTALTLPDEDKWIQDISQLLDSNKFGYRDTPLRETSSPPHGDSIEYEIE